MSPSNLFRTIVVASVASAVAGGAIDLVVPNMLPAVLEQAYAEHIEPGYPDSPANLALSAIVLVLVAGGCAGTIGMLAFRRWARAVSLWVSVLALASFPMIGPSLTSGWANIFMELSSMLWGAGLSMAYFSSISVRFRKVAGAREADGPSRSNTG